MSNHEYRIEVWDRDGGALLETCCRAKTDRLIRAAWPAAIEDYPGRFLICYNGAHVTDRAEVPLAPRSDTEPAPVGRISLFDLPEWYQLFAYCADCGRMEEVDRRSPKLEEMRLRPLADLAIRLKCGSCGSHGRSKFMVRKIPR
ncbi:hypothetical protein SAMN05892877_103409 [Rhizobium subbaraonis]|uniref:Uncharacterized protein n=1 Tax=Rhizobium subbaraonis TaxID=908946 RepID=A0A285U557_9HYPH|nr:hypothetical protein [Rhizobium subbaraonis]SOC37065.1 hypothetical protein SAMN05892877_103409 [Rhizobium subbaraonis]